MAKHSRKTRQNPPKPARPFPPGPPERRPVPEDHEGATEGRVGDRTGPGAGYDDEPEKVRDRGGVADS